MHREEKPGKKESEFPRRDPRQTNRLRSGLGVRSRGEPTSRRTSSSSWLRLKHHLQTDVACERPEGAAVWCILTRDYATEVREDLCLTAPPPLPRHDRVSSTIAPKVRVSFSFRGYSSSRSGIPHIAISTFFFIILGGTMFLPALKDVGSCRFVDAGLFFMDQLDGSCIDGVACGRHASLARQTSTGSWFTSTMKRRNLLPVFVKIAVVLASYCFLINKTLSFYCFAAQCSSLLVLSILIISARLLRDDKKRFIRT